MPRKDQEERPLTRVEERFATLFCKYGDIYKAAEKAGIGKNMAVRTFHLIQVQEEIERQKDVVRQERARQQVETENLTNDFLDKELIDVIRSEKGALKKEAIQLGYVVTGRIQAGNTRTLEVPTEPNKGTAPNFYQAFVRVDGPVASILPDETASNPAKPEVSEKPPQNMPEIMQTQPQPGQQPAEKPSKNYTDNSQNIPTAAATSVSGQASQRPPRKAGRLTVG
jgi:hypothetical protein